MFGVSRSVVRESLKSLSFLGLVDTKARRGSVIGSLDMDRLGQCLDFQISVTEYSRNAIQEARIIMEVNQLPLAMNNLTAKHIEELFDIVDKCDLAVTENDPALFSEYDRRMHETLLKIGGNQILITFCNLLQRYFSVEGYSNVTRDEMQMAAQEHRGIVEALKENNELLAQGILLKHLKRALRNDNVKSHLNL